VEKLDDGTLVPQTQPDEGAVYAAKLTRDEARIDWRLSAVQIERQVRALNPWDSTGWASCCCPSCCYQSP